MFERTACLREAAIQGLHREARIPLPKNWDTVQEPGSIAERKALALKKIFSDMPLYIGPRELLVGTRTVYASQGETQDKSDMGLRAMPHYLTEKDKAEFGGYDGEFYTKAHYTADYNILLQKGIDGIIKEARANLEGQGQELKAAWLRAVIISYEGLSLLIERYSVYAGELAQAEQDPVRAKELLRIAAVCGEIAHRAPKDFWEACQLFWFAHLGLTIENFSWMNYGRADQFLFPYFHTVPLGEARQLVDCLLLKLYDGVDIKDRDTGTFAAQHNLTLGGVTPGGENAVNELTMAFVDSLSRTRLPEPEVSCRIHSKNPPEFLLALSALSVSGLNCIAYYNDDQFIKSMKNAGISDAEDYAFDLCQDINIPGRGDFYVSYGVDLGRMLLKTMEALPKSFHGFMDTFKQNIALDLKQGLEAYNSREKAIRAYVAGDRDYIYHEVEAGRLDWSCAGALQSPLPLTSGLYHGCVERGTDLSWFGCELADKGAMVGDPVVGINGLAAIRQLVYTEKSATLQEIIAACRCNFEGCEPLRQRLWKAPKWGNDDDFVDMPAKEILEFSCDEIMKYKTPTGARHLAGIHQPHPVFFGRNLPATPEGRRAGEPVPVTLSPENGTMQNGPTAAFQSCAKIDPNKYQWNNCVMLQYFSSVFQGNAGSKLFANLLKSYFTMGGTQHQPNVVDVAELRAAQQNPGAYKDLIVRMWGVSAHFVDLPQDVQDEFIARFEGL